MTRFRTSPVLKPLPEAEREALVSLRDTKVFELVFDDGKIFHTIAETIIGEPIGLPHFLDKPDNHRYHLFVPKEALKSYNFDSCFNKGLVEHKEVEPQPQRVMVSPPLMEQYMEPRDANERGWKMGIRWIPESNVYGFDAGAILSAEGNFNSLDLDSLPASRAEGEERRAGRSRQPPGSTHFSINRYFK